MQVLRYARVSFLGIFLLSILCVEGKSVAFFSPEDHPQSHLISYLSQAKKRILCAIFMFTDQGIADALIDAKKRGVDVQIIADHCSIDSEHGKVNLLTKYNIPAYVFKTGKSKFGALMHNKYAIIDNAVWTGSFNWTNAANTRNRENVIYNDEQEICDTYVEHFEKLKQVCTPVGASSHYEQSPPPPPSSPLAFFYKYLPFFLLLLFFLLLMFISSMF